jgi:hypothetical protein
MELQKVMPTSPTPGRSEYAVGHYAASHLSPCEVFNCPMARTCKAEKLACSSFAHFVIRPRRPGLKLRRPTEPSEQIYKQIFDEEQHETPS